MAFGDLTMIDLRCNGHRNLLFLNKMRQQLWESGSQNQKSSSKRCNNFQTVNNRSQLLRLIHLYFVQNQTGTCQHCCCDLSSFRFIDKSNDLIHRTNGQRCGKQPNSFPALHPAVFFLIILIHHIIRLCISMQQSHTGIVDVLRILNAMMNCIDADAQRKRIKSFSVSQPQQCTFRLSNAGAGADQQIFSTMFGKILLYGTQRKAPALHHSPCTIRNRCSCRRFLCLLSVSTSAIVNPIEHSFQQHISELL